MNSNYKSIKNDFYKRMSLKMDMARLKGYFFGMLCQFEKCEDKAHPRWFQYVSYEIVSLTGNRRDIKFLFRSSQAPIYFEVQLSINYDGDVDDHLFDYNDAYEYFKELKYSIIGYEFRS